MPASHSTYLSLAHTISSSLKKICCGGLAPASQAPAENTPQLKSATPDMAWGLLGVS